MTREEEAIATVRDRTSPEERFFLQALSSFVHHGDGRDVPTPPEGLRWDRVNQLVQVNNVGPVFHLLLSGRGLPLPLEAWGQVRMQVLFANIQKLRLAVRLFGLLEAAGVAAVGLRGVSLAHGTYPDPGLRPMKDLDILVDPDKGPQIEEALAAAGFTPSNRLRSQLVYTVGGVEIELHLSLLTAKRYRAAFDAGELLSSRVRVQTAEGAIYRLPPEQELLELVAHAFVHHELQGLTRMLDIALVMSRPGLDWMAVGSWCRTARLSNMYRFTLSLADALFRPGSTTYRGAIDAKLPRGADRLFASYSRQYLGGDSLLHHACRKRNLFYVAERPGVKLNQFWRLFSASHFREMRLVAGRNAQRKAPAAGR